MKNEVNVVFDTKSFEGKKGSEPSANQNSFVIEKKRYVLHSYIPAQLRTTLVSWTMILIAFLSVLSAVQVRNCIPLVVLL